MAGLEPGNSAELDGLLELVAMSFKSTREVDIYHLFMGGYRSRLAGYLPEAWREDFRDLYYRSPCYPNELWREAYWLAGYEKASLHIKQGLIVVKPAVLVA